MRFYSYVMCENFLNLLEQFCHPLPNELDHFAVHVKMQNAEPIWEKFENLDRSGGILS